MINKEQELRNYEELIVFHPESTVQEQKELYTTSSKVIKEAKGKIYRLDTWGSRFLANPQAKKASKGWYFHMIFQASPDTIKELRRRLRINDKVLYFHHEKLPNKQSYEDYIKDFLESISQTQKRAAERQAKFQKKQGFK